MLGFQLVLRQQIKPFKMETRLRQTLFNKFHSLSKIKLLQISHKFNQVPLFKTQSHLKLLWFRTLQLLKENKSFWLANNCFNNNFLNNRKYLINYKHKFNSSNHWLFKLKLNLNSLRRQLFRHNSNNNLLQIR